MYKNLVNMIRENDNIQVYHDGKTYTSTVIEVSPESKNLTIRIPLCKMKKLFIFKGTTYNAVITSRSHGLIHFSFELSTYNENNPVLQIEGSIKNNQRREFFRVNVVNELKVYTLDKDEKKFKKIKLLKRIGPNFETYIKDLSLGGLAFLCEEKIPLETLIKLNFNLDEEKEFWIECLVKRCKKTLNEKYNIGAEFQDLKKDKQKILNKYLVAKQREDLKFQRSQEERTT